MEKDRAPEGVSLWGRLGLGLRVILNADFAGRVSHGLWQREPRPIETAPERADASGLMLLGALQREGRLVDFLQQDVTGFSDEQVGAAARVVHSGCRKVLQQYLDLEPASNDPEGAEVTVPKGFDPQRWRLTGNVAGQPPFRGTLRHHGWVAGTIRMPTVSESIDPRVLAPAEVELP